MKKNYIVGLQAACMIVIAFGAAYGFLYGEIDPILGYFGWMASALGLACALLGLRTLNRNLTIWVDPQSELVTRGIYNISRNPIYLGGLLMSSGWTMLFDSPVCAVGTFALAVVLNFKVRMEEKALEAKFGAPYVAYKHRIGRWLFFL